LYNEGHHKFNNLTELVEFSDIRLKLIFNDLEVKVKEDEYVQYFEHTTGKVHLYLVYQALVETRNSMYALKEQSEIKTED